MKHIALTLVFAVVLAGAVDARAAPPPPPSLKIKVLSNRADLLSGGDALVEVRPQGKVDMAAVRMDVDGRDVTGAFARRADGRYVGLVEGLELGPNVLTATMANGHGARITLTNHPIGGPIFSGPQLQPWYCLPGAADAQCNRPVGYSLMYRAPGAPAFLPYDPQSPPPTVTTTTTDQGQTVPYIVRVETGNLDRSQYRIAVLYDPGRPWTPWAPQRGWNRKVYVAHGAGCGMGHSEGVAPDVLLDLPLSRGFAVMSTALESNTENCGVAVQAESVMMAKEHLVETYGEIRYLFGFGSSGGSLAQNQIANAYPGLYDGLTLGATFADIPMNDLLDCEALLRYWNDPSRWGAGVVWTEPQMAAAAGLAATTVCRVWDRNFANMFDPKAGVECDVPTQEPARVYHPQTNPTGVRCSIQDYLVNIFGPRPSSRWGSVEKAIGRGFANRPYDNVGIQYGLRALVAGKITPAQFVDLNAKVGSVDIDYATQPGQRIEADPAAIATAYRSGVLNEANNLDRVPIIDIPVPGDRYEIHDNYKSWALRARLEAANGHHGNHVIWYGPYEGGITPNPADARTFSTMDEWLSGVEADTSTRTLEEKVVANRPASAQDRCNVPDRSVCNTAFGPVGNVRWGAGGGIANDVIKCQRVPLLQSDYFPILFSAAQWAQLEAAFPSGVCDWSKPGIGQQAAVPWLTYQSGPGGKKLPAAPTYRTY